MIDSKNWVVLLKRKNFNFFTGVPCSFFKSAINAVLNDRSLRYVMVPNEGAGLAAAAGAALAGERPVVMIQNSGLGNLINPLTSLSMIYRIPTLIFISGRAYGVEDEPQHEIIGQTMGGILDAIGVPHEDMALDEPLFEAALDRAMQWMQKENRPYVFFVRKDTLSDYDCAPAASPYPLKRIDAIRIIGQSIAPEDLIVATTGMPSRELFSVQDRKRNFYMQGSMGHAAAIGLGLVLSRPKQRVLVLDGDGAALMHLGIFSSIGYYRPANFYHLMLDNEAYESTGNQDTTSSSTDFCRIAASCGYSLVKEVSEEKALGSALSECLSSKGPVFLRIKINRLPTSGIPRITTKYKAPEIATQFGKEIMKDIH